MSSIDYKLHEEYKKLCLYSYKEDAPDQICGWGEIVVYQNKNTGYFARVYYKNNQVVIVSRGTEIDDKNDRANDRYLINAKMPTQINDAKKLYEKVKGSLFSDCDITFVGHSLGGSISEIMSVKTGCPAVTFNPYGVSEIPEIKNSIKNANVINYGNVADVIFRSNMRFNVGKIRIIFDDNINSKKYDSYYVNHSLEALENTKFNNKHFLENMGDLKNSIDIDDIKLPTSSATKNLIKGSISKNMYKDENGHWVTIDGNHVFIEDD